MVMAWRPAARRRRGLPGRRAFRSWPDSTALPAALDVYPGGDHRMALITCALLSAGLTALSLAGSSVAEAYQVLLRAR
jgi:hypothetical protein